MSLWVGPATRVLLCASGLAAFFLWDGCHGGSLNDVRFPNLLARLSGELVGWALGEKASSSLGALISTQEGI